MKVTKAFAQTWADRYVERIGWLGAKLLDDIGTAAITPGF